MLLKITIPAGEAKMAPPLGVILGQYQLPGAKICLEFNKQTSQIFPGVPLRTEIKKVGQSGFEIQIKEPPLPFLISQQLVNVGGRSVISLTDFYDVYRLVRSLREFSTHSDSTLVSLMLSTLKSTGCSSIVY